VNMKVWALAYAKKGWPIFPCKGKEPLTEHGLKDATCSEEQIQKWWDGWPDADIGCAFNGIVLDIDPKNGGLESIKDKHLPPTPTVKTGGGGWHYYFSGNIGGHSGAILPGVDVKSAPKGYVIAPPSLHASGNRYAWAESLGPKDVDLSPLPQWAVDLLSKKAPKKKLDVAKAVSNLKQGSWHDMMLKIVARYVHDGWTDDEIWFAVKGNRLNGHTEEDTLTEVTEMITSAREKGFGGKDFPFKCLGHGDHIYYYFNLNTKQVLELSPGNHVPNYLCSLAAPSFWKEKYGQPEKDRVSWQKAISEMMAKCTERGVFDVSRIRGLGAWLEGMFIIINCGDRLIVNGERKQVGMVVENGCIYPAGRTLDINTDEKLSVDESKKILDICKLLPFEKDIDIHLFSGWLTVAPICGALPWRPHIWLTGPTGSGKSWSLENVLRPLLGDMRLFVQSGVTEAGIRQTLGNDALPVLFDEAEGDDPGSIFRIQRIIELARQSSSEGGASIIKGGAGGTARKYCVRSCFAFSSIDVSIAKSADENRISVLPMVIDNDNERFLKLKGLVAATLSKEWIQKFHARTIFMIPTILENFKQFARAGLQVFGSARMADQIGMLLAGAYSLHSNGLISYDAALEWMKQHSWSEQKRINEETQESVCLQLILQQTCQVKSTTEIKELSIGEMINEYAKGDNPSLADACNKALLRVGIRVDSDYIYIANRHPWLQDRLQKRGIVSWRTILSRIPGASVTEKAIRFGGSVSKAIGIPANKAIYS